MQDATPRPMLLDELAPHYDATRIEHRVIDGDIPDVYSAVLTVDFVRAWQDNAAVRALFGLRATAEAVVARLRGGEPPAMSTDSLRLADLPERGQWIRLGEEAPFEIVFGVVGHFWGGETVWEDTDADDFPDFSRPGFARIAANFSLRPYGAGRTLVSYEARTMATDEQSRQPFLRYWRAVSPGVGIVMRSQLAVIERQAKD